MTHKSLAELREEMRAVARGERQSSLIPAASAPKRRGKPMGVAYPCTPQDPKHVNPLKDGIAHQGDIISPVDEQWDGCL